MLDRSHRGRGILAVHTRRRQREHTEESEQTENR